MAAVALAGSGERRKGVEKAHERAARFVAKVRSQGPAFRAIGLLDPVQSSAIHVLSSANPVSD